jgi:hypothetical protein
MAKADQEPLPDDGVDVFSTEPQWHVATSGDLREREKEKNK